MDRINRYVDEVLSFIIADNKTKERIREDLVLKLSEPRAPEDTDSVLTRLGDPRKLRANSWIRSMKIKANCSTNCCQIFRKMRNTELAHEYRSKTTIFGLPLIHIKFNRYGRPALAKGIIAIGTVSLGKSFPLGNTDRDNKHRGGFGRRSHLTGAGRSRLP